MAGLGTEIVDQAFKAAQLLAEVGIDTALLRQDIQHAERALHAGLLQAETRVALLERLSQAHELGQIPDAAYRNLIATMGRLLKGSADLTTELTRITQSRRR